MTLTSSQVGTNNNIHSPRSVMDTQGTTGASSTDTKPKRRMPRLFGLPVVVFQRFAISFAFLFCTFLIANYFKIFSSPLQFDVTSRLTYAVRGLVFSMFPLVFLVLKIATMRAGKPFDLGNNPVKQKTHYTFDVYTRVLQNTMEQTIPHVVNVAAISTFLSAEYFFLVPLCICWFVFGRLAFLVGYLDPKVPARRFYGFLISSFPTLVGLCYCSVQLLN